MLFDRGSADDYNNWEKLGNPGWGFSSLLPYFKKVSLAKIWLGHSQLTLLTECYLHAAKSGSRRRV